MPLTPEQQADVDLLRRSTVAVNEAAEALIRQGFSVTFTINHLVMMGVGETPVLVPTISRTERF